MSALPAQSRRQRHTRTPQQQLDEYIAFVIDNLTLSSLTTEQQSRELVILAVTCLAFKARHNVRYFIIRPSAPAAHNSRIVFGK